jgi:enoyl-[acyl-carrier protein] reductase I
VVPIDLSGKNGIILGVANERSIAWGIAQSLSDAGARLALTYQGDRLKERVERLSTALTDPVLLPCDVTDDGQIEQVFATLSREFGHISFLIHSIAFANRDDLTGRFVDTGREGFRIAMEVSAYSLLPLVRHAAPLMTNGGSIVAMTFHASQRVYPGYNVMGSAKAALEHAVRQLAAEMGPSNIRVNAISAGPLETLAARGISGFRDMRHTHAERAPLQRNITAEEVAQTALFLCSGMASGITGSVIPVDAGYHIMAV